MAKENDKILGISLDPQAIRMIDELQKELPFSMFSRSKFIEYLIRKEYKEIKGDKDNGK